MAGLDSWTALKRHKASVPCYIVLSAIMLFAVVCLLPARPALASSNSQGVEINVVYDDSGSMVSENGTMITRWSQAKYAMEVFGAMLGENDTMNIYPMSAEGALGLTVYGSDANRVASIHNMNANYSNTPFSTVTSAGNALLSSGGNKEKWLVVITDGAFDDGATPTSTVQETLNGYNDQGIHTAYLGIGNAAAALSGNEDKGGYASVAQDGSDVLVQVTAIANQIFMHQVLDDGHIQESQGTVELSIDIPTDQVVIFAQGQNASIGTVRLNGNELAASSIQNVKYSDVLPSNYPSAIADDSLKGVLATFDAGSDPYESGTYSIEVSGADVVEYYYAPGVEVNCDLLQNGAVVNSGDELYAGSYDISMNYINPLNGEAIESDLLPSDFSLAVANNGQEQVVESAGGTVQLTQGEVTLTACASLPGHVALETSKEYKVLPDPIDLAFSLDAPDYASDDLAQGAESVTVSVTNQATGEALTEEEWQATELTVANANGVDWAVARGTDVGTWTLTPSSSDISSVVDSGSMTFDIEAVYQVNDQYAHGISHETIPVNVNFLDFVKRNAGLIIGGLLLAVMVLGNLLKKRIRVPKKANPTCRNRQNKKIPPHEHRRVKKTFWRIWFPFVPEEALVYCSDSSVNCNFPNAHIQATGKNRFKLLNYNTLAANRTKICGIQYKDEELSTLKKKEFGFGNFSLASVDQANKEIGLFRFN